jgi:hypothetical protein
MELPYEKKEKTLAELKERGITWRTRYYNFLNPEGLNNFVSDMENVSNNPLKHQITEFDYQTQTDGTPFAMLRFRDDDKIDDVKERRFSIWAKLYTTAEFNDLDATLNSHDKTTVYLLGEKRLTMKTGDFFILLIWATINRPTKFTEGLDVLRSIFAAKFRQ